MKAPAVEKAQALKAAKATTNGLVAPEEPIKQRRPRSWLWIAALIILAIAATVTRSLWQPHRALNVITASGSVEADETVLAPKVAGRLAKLFVDEGDSVKKGELIAQIDDSELRAQLGEAQANLAAAQAKLDEAIAGNRPQQIAEAEDQLRAAESSAIGQRQILATAATNLRKVTDLKATVDAARSRVGASMAVYRQAQQALSLVLAGTRPDQIDQAQAAVDQAKVQESDALKDYARAETLYSEGAIARQAFDHAMDARDAATRSREQALAHLADLQAGARPQEIAEARMQMLQARSNLAGDELALANAKTELNDRLAAQNQYISASSGSKVAAAQEKAASAQLNLMLAGSRDEDIRAARAARDQASKAVQYARELVADAKVYAASDGVVETKSALVGETLEPGSPVVTVADLDHVWIRVYVPEDQYGKVRIGEAVSVAVDSFPNRTFNGRVASVNSMFDFTPKNAQTNEERVKLVFGVKIYVENPGRVLKPGMPGDASIRF